MDQRYTTDTRTTSVFHGENSAAIEEHRSAGTSPCGIPAVVLIREGR